MIGLAVLTLSACGGGGESSTSDGASMGGDEFAGTYEGSLSGTLASLGSSVTVNENIRIVISYSGQVTLTGSEGGSSVGSLNGNAFTITETTRFDPGGGAVFRSEMGSE